MTKIMILGLLIAACQTDKSTGKKNDAGIAADNVVKIYHHTESLAKILDAHGGYSQWSSMKQLSYTKGDEKTITNLKDRKIRLESEKQTIGFDGENVWVTPDSVDASRTRFYHNLYFYFYAMPFVLGDPGIRYEDLDQMEIAGKTYKGIKVSYESNIGDSPKDNYIIWYDPDTYKMEWLMYTVTYDKSEASEKYNLIKYDRWGVYEGLTIPEAIQWYEYKEGEVGKMSGEVVFDNIQISTDAPSDDLFKMPEGAKISLPPTMGG